MPISFTVYSNGNSKSQTVSVDFRSDVLAQSNAAFDSTQHSFFKISTSAKDDNGEAFGVRIIETESQLALGTNTKRWANWDAANAAGVAVSDPYPDIKSMIYDHIYDLVNGHDANQNGSDSTARPPMDFA